MRRCRSTRIAVIDEVAHPRASLGQHLEDVPVGCLHGVEHSSDVFPWHALVEQIAHGVDEDEPRAPPGPGLIHPFGSKRQVESRLVGVSGDAPKPFGKSFGVAVVAAGAQLRTPGHGVPRALRPLDGGLFGHGRSISLTRRLTLAHRMTPERTDIVKRLQIQAYQTND